MIQAIAERYRPPADLNHSNNWYGKACHYLPLAVSLRRTLETAMQTMNISLPDQLKDFVDEQIGSGRYSSVSEYVRELIRDDERRKAQDKLETMLLEALQSGEPTEMTRQDWADIRREALKQLENRKSRKSA